MKNKEQLIDIILSKYKTGIVIDELDKLLKIKYELFKFNPLPAYGIYQKTLSMYINILHYECISFYQNIILKNGIPYIQMRHDTNQIKINLYDFLQIYSDEELTKFILEYII